MYGEYLARKLPYYLVLGTLCSILVALNITVMKYNGSLGAIAERMEVLDAKSQQMEKDTDALAGRLKEFRTMRPERFWETTGDEYILKAVDDIRQRMHGDVLAVTDINRRPSELALSMELSFSFDSYRQVLGRLVDLERMTLPFFRFTSFSFQKEQPDRALCSIRGSIVIPAARRDG